MHDEEYEKKYLDELKAIVLNIIGETKCEVFLFGSRAAERIKLHSDYDIGISGLSEKDFDRAKWSIMDAVEESMIPHDIDIVNFDTAVQGFKDVAYKDIVIWKNG